MLNINKISYLKVEKIEHLSDLEPIEFYFKTAIIKNNKYGEGLGKTKITSIKNALNNIEKIIEKIESISPF